MTSPELQTDTENAADDAGNVEADGQGDDGPAAQLSMAASVVLSALPRNTHQALQEAGQSTGKVTVRFHPVGSAPRLNQAVFKVGAAQHFASVIRFLRRKLGVKDSDSVFCYVNSVFAPALDEVVGNLWTCFKVKDELVVAYAVTPAFG